MYSKLELNPYCQLLPKLTRFVGTFHPSGSDVLKWVSETGFAPHRERNTHKREAADS